MVLRMYYYLTHMAKDACLFSYVCGAPEKNIYVVDYYSLMVTGSGDVECNHD